MTRNRKGGAADVLRLVLLAALLVPLPLRGGFNNGSAFVAAAWAKDGGSSGSSGSSGSGHGSGSHDDDGDDDHSGSHGGPGRSGPDGTGSGGKGGSSGGPQSRGGGVSTTARIVVRGDDITVTYADGWRERVRSGRYIMTDPRSRTVIDRPARRADISRLFSYRP